MIDQACSGCVVRYSDSSCVVVEIIYYEEVASPLPRPYSVQPRFAILRPQVCIMASALRDRSIVLDFDVADGRLGVWESSADCGCTSKLLHGSAGSATFRRNVGSARELAGALVGDSEDGAEFAYGQSRVLEFGGGRSELGGCV